MTTPMGGRAWAPAERARLAALVAAYGGARVRWAEVAARLGGRTPNQCRTQHRAAFGGPRRNRRWTREELRTLAKCVRFYGRRWALIQRHYFPGVGRAQLRQAYLYAHGKLRRVVDALEGCTDAAGRLDAAAAARRLSGEQMRGLLALSREVLAQRDALEARARVPCTRDFGVDVAVDVLDWAIHSSELQRRIYAASERLLRHAAGGE